MTQQENIEKEIRTKKLHPKGWKLFAYYLLPMVMFGIGLGITIIILCNFNGNFPIGLILFIWALALILFLYITFSHFNFEKLSEAPDTHNFSDVIQRLISQKGWRLKYKSQNYYKFEVFVKFSGLYDVTIFIDDKNLYLHTIPALGEIIYNFGTKRIKKAIFEIINS